VLPGTFSNVTLFSISADGAKNRTEEHQAKQEVRRKEAGLEWMTQAPERPAPVVVESEDVHTLEGEVTLVLCRVFHSKILFLGSGMMDDAVDFLGLVFLCPNSRFNIMEDLGLAFAEAPEFCKRVESILEKCWQWIAI
jgi:hypothetical protein